MNWGKMEQVVDGLGGISGVERFLKGELTVTKTTRSCYDDNGKIKIDDQLSYGNIDCIGICDLLLRLLSRAEEIAWLKDQDSSRATLCFPESITIMEDDWYLHLIKDRYPQNQKHSCLVIIQNFPPKTRKPKEREKVRMLSGPITTTIAEAIFKKVID